jgi:hypothetical protein
MGIEADALHEIFRDQSPPEKRRGSLAILSAHEIFGVPAGLEPHLLVLNSGRAAFLVDRVERIVATGSPRPLPLAFQGEERVWFQGLAVIDGVIFPIVNPKVIEREALTRASTTAGGSDRVARPTPSQEKVSK